MNEKVYPLEDISSVLDSIFGTGIETPAEPSDEMLDTLKAIQVHLSLIDKRLSSIEEILTPKEEPAESRRVITPETIKVNDLERLFDKPVEDYTKVRKNIFRLY